MSVKKFQKKVRYINGLTILFYTSRSVYIKKGINKIVCHMWYSKKESGDRTYWSNFIRQITLNKGIYDLLDIVKLAEKNGVSIQGCYGKFPDIDNKTIIIKD